LEVMIFAIETLAIRFIFHFHLKYACY